MARDISRAPWLCLVTDRRRLTRAAGRPDDEWRPALQAQIRGAVQAGVTLVQIRERDLDAQQLLALTRELVALAAGSPTRIVVNDRLDIALAAGAAGVHLRGDSPVPEQVADLTPPGFLLGKSVHSAADVAGSPGAEYFIAGTVFPTASKADNRTTLGIAGLAGIVRAAGTAVVLAIGGVTEETAGEIATSGAHGLASIGAFLPETPGEDISSAVARRADTLRRVFTKATADR